MGSDEAVTPQTDPRASSADADEMKGLEMEDEKEDKGKDKDNHTVDCSNSALPQTFYTTKTLFKAHRARTIPRPPAVSLPRPPLQDFLCSTRYRIRVRQV